MAKEDDNMLSYLVYLFIGLVILAGVYVLSTYGTEIIYSSIFGSSEEKKRDVSKYKTETPSGNEEEVTYEMVDETIVNCPNVLIRKGNLLLLINTHQEPEEGTNPVIFNHLDDYIHYVKTQRETYDNYCPVLFLQEESNAQGENVYRVRPGPFDQQGGAPSPNVAMSEIKGILSFFKRAPSSETTFVDDSAKITAPSPFNKDDVNTNDGFVTTGEGYLNTPSETSETFVGFSYSPEISGVDFVNGATPYVSDNNKLNRVENISTENAMNLPIVPTNEMNDIQLYQKSNYSAPPTSIRYSEGMTPNDSQDSLPPLTPPANVPMYKLPIQTQLFNGSLGPYVGTPVDQISANTDVTRNVVPALDASRDDAPYNQNQYPGFDPYGQDIGNYTNVDQIHDSTKKQGTVSDNPMDPNWGGVLYTRQQVMSGKYDDNEVTKPIYGGAPNIMSIPSLMKDGGPPNFVVNKSTNENCSGHKDMKTRHLRSEPESA